MFNLFTLTGGLGAAAVTTEMLEPIVDAITSNIAVIMPVGITVFGVMVGISLVPRIIKKFTNA